MQYNFKSDDLLCSTLSGPTQNTLFSSNFSTDKCPTLFYGISFKCFNFHICMKECNSGSSKLLPSWKNLEKCKSISKTWIIYKKSGVEGVTAQKMWG
jgi:hypothetical protein